MTSTRVDVRTLKHLSAEERALLARVKAAVLSVEPSAEVVLYGSRGDAESDADWDLLVLLDGRVDRRRMETVRDRIYDVEMDEETCPVLSTLVRSRDEWGTSLWRAMPLRQNVERDGVDL